MPTSKFDIADYLDSKEMIAEYLNTVLEEGDQADVISAIRQILAQSKTKLRTLDELIDKHVGEVGTEERDQFEYDLKLDVIGQIIWEARQQKKIDSSLIRELVEVNKYYFQEIESSV